MDSNLKLSNVIGAPFSDYVLQQLYIRAARNSTVTRSNEEVLFLANKTGWVRLISSVDINLSPSELREYYNKLGVGPGYDTPKDLARDWILEAGTSKQNGNGITLRTGIGPDGAYGLGGTEELGYRPMPGLDSVTIETVGRLGSLRQATISFKVWNMNQLNVVEALYFRLGFSMLLEWGHTQYFDNTNTFRTSEIYGIDNPFAAGLRKEDIQQRIAQKTKQTSGNYGGMLGIVSNFTWSFNEDGGYDCVVRLIGQGAVMDSLRTNQAYTLPSGTLKEYKKNQSAIEAAIERATQERIRAILDQQARSAISQQSTLESAPTSITPLLNRLKTYDTYPSSKTLNDLIFDYGVYSFDKKENFTQKAVSNVAGYYTLFNNNPNAAVRIAAENAYGGFWFDQTSTGFARLPYTDSNVVVFDTELLNYATETIPVFQAGQQTTLNNISTGGFNGTFVSKFFELKTRKSRIGQPSITSANIVNPVSEPVENPLNKPLPDAKVSVTYNFDNLQTAIGSKDVYVTITATTSTDNGDNDFQPTRLDLLNALDLWQRTNNTSILQNVSIASNEKNEAIFTGKFQTTTVAAYSGRPENKAAAVEINRGQDKKSVITYWTIETNNPGFIKKILPSQQPSAVSRQVVGTANTGTTDSTLNQANTSQVESTAGFSSALHAMLVVVQTKAQASALNAKDVLPVSILEETRRFFEEGSLKGVLNLPSSATVGPDGIPFDLLRYGKKGYNSSLMMDKTLYDSIPDVDFNKLCKAYVIKYVQGGDEGSTQSVHCPVYISLGYLLAFLNNMCLIYDSTEPTSFSVSPQGSQKRPYIYIDFNPETNFCLTSPQQFSIDPYTCLVPFNATLEDYKQIFPTATIANNLDPAAFNPQVNNVVTKALNDAGLEFKTLQGGSTYQGKMMNILLNIDYLLGLIRDFAGADPEHAVNLQPFLERILVDVNKSLGNINSFRVGYRDESNTVQLLDDQWVPSYQGITGADTNILRGTEYMQKLKTNKIFSGLLPLFNSTTPAQLPVAGTFSLARQFQFKTVMSTKLASMIAISAQANTGSVNSKDHSSLSYLNNNFQDRYKPFIQDPTGGSSGANINTKDRVNQKSNDQRAAELFNVHVGTIYSSLQLSPDKIDLARNYYIERMSKVKSSDLTTSSAPFIPADLELTIDGVSGIIMGNAFTIPEDRLPLSLRGENGRTKIGFIVTGLTHTIQNNEWLTRIKGQMIKLRGDVNIPASTAIISSVQRAIAPPLSTYTGLTGDVIEDAVSFIKSEEALYSAVPNGYRPIVNPTPDTLVYAYKVGADKPTIGWGTTVYRTGLRAGLQVSINDVITLREAEAELRAAVVETYNFIRTNLRPVRPLRNGEFTALVSLGYNVGTTRLRDSNIWTSVSQGADRDIIAGQIRRFATTLAATGAVLPGLIARRQKESQIFLS